MNKQIDYQLTEIGLLPNDWKISRIDDYFSIQQGKQVSKKNREGNNQKPFLRTANVFWNKLKLSDLDHMHFSSDEESRLALKEGDLLVCEGGDVGRTAIWHEELESCYYQNHLHRLRKKDDSISEYYFQYWLRYAFTNDLYKGRANVTTIPNLSKSRLSELKFPVLELETQNNIAQILSLIRKVIDQQEKIIETTTEFKVSLMHRLFTEGLNDESQKETEIGLVPNSWKILPLSQTGEVIYGIQAAVANNFKPIGIKILTNKNINLNGTINTDVVNYFVLKTERHKNTILKKGDILFNWRSGSKEHVGKTALFNLEGEYVHSSFILRIRTNTTINNKYLFYFLSFLRESGYFLKFHSFMINAKFNKSALNNLPVIVPSREEQDIFVNSISSLDRKILSMRTKRSLYEQMFNTLLHQLMSGELRVDNINLN